MIIQLLLILASSCLVTSKDEVSIKAREYCYGCLSTVEAYSSVAATRFATMQKAGVQEGVVVDADELATLLCDDSYFHPLKKYNKYSCIKILDEHRNDFLGEFSGNYTLTITTHAFSIICIQYIFLS